MSDPPLIYCVGCGKTQHDVAKMIIMTATPICNECVMLCYDILQEELPPPEQEGGG
jgi:ATP-dependent Clp protease ATP-binding subunit ClpX